jgi:hypothetical protein
MDNSHSELTKRRVISIITLVLVMTRTAFAGDKVLTGKETGDFKPPVITSVDLRVTLLEDMIVSEVANEQAGMGLHFLMSPAILGRRDPSADIVFPFLTMTHQIRKAHPGVHTVRFTRVDNQILVIPRLEGLKELPKKSAPISMGFSRDFNDPRKYHVLDVTIGLSAKVLYHINAGRIMEAHEIFGKAFDNRTPGISLVVAPEITQEKMPEHRQSHRHGS